ncbi:hypothetical protein I7I53_01309 [Histoplasma capsulatum var. duboisii H88]|uniref:Uncharacterized protein n=1 Tax=Ajellomyces capsulatus (strain H88) TaxID=544711 RepID=A0A8A1LLJ1_AJEC8|nr:hypothetical protein I7I53_01309 [Histoplasma capsulatum var. duboisii H88]
MVDSCRYFSPKMVTLCPKAGFGHFQILAGWLRILSAVSAWWSQPQAGQIPDTLPPMIANRSDTFCRAICQRALSLF